LGGWQVDVEQQQLAQVLDGYETVISRMMNDVNNK
jgi:hypothetical protein